MKVFMDYHHSALGRSLISLLSGRLGFEVYLPNYSFVAECADAGWGIFRSKYLVNGGYSPLQQTWPTHQEISYEEFAEMDFDVFIASRTESQDTILRLRDDHCPNAKLVAQSGNEGMPYTWGAYRNLMSSDAYTYHGAPGHVHKILYPQELGWYFGKDYVPLTDTAARSVGTYINRFCHLTDAHVDWSDFATGNCPHCQQPAPASDVVSPVDYWRELRDLVPEVTFDLYGFENEAEGAVMLDEMGLIQGLAQHALTFQFKMHEGYGHALCQSVISGRPVIVPKRFFAYRFARRYLIPDVTCFEVDLFDPKDAAAVVREVTADKDRLERICRQCYKVGQALFDWEYEAWRVEHWWNNLL
jgi:hypothetical protein